MPSNFSHSFSWFTYSGLFALLFVAACSDDGNDCNPNSSFCISATPHLHLEPSRHPIEIVDHQMEAGESYIQNIRISNIGDKALSVRSALLEYEAPEGASSERTPAFSIDHIGGSFPFSIYPRTDSREPQYLDIAIKYLKQDDSLPRKATLRLVSNDYFYSDGGESTVILTTDVGIPSLAVTPQRLDFGMVPTSEEELALPLTLLNTGSRKLTVHGFKTRLDGRFGVRFDGFEGSGIEAFDGIDLEVPIVIEPGRTHAIMATFLPDSPSPAEGELVIFSDDPRKPNGEVVALSANKSGPCIEVSPRKMQFGGKLVGSSSLISLEIFSCGTEPLSLSSIAFAPESSSAFETFFLGLPEGFENGPSLDQPLLVPINESIEVTVRYSPERVSPRDDDGIPIPDEALLLIASNSNESEVRVEMSGTGTNTECITPIIRVEEGNEVIPQTVVHLSAKESFAPFGAITDYIWSVTPPEGISRPNFLPNAVSREPILSLDAVGVYTIGLKVRGEDGKSSGNLECPDARYDILVQPDEAIHVELTWISSTLQASPTLPSLENEDPIETVVKGADLDLHFAHENAIGPDIDGDGELDPWFDTTWDVFWYNRHPQWGSLSPEVNDDPRLDRDDTEYGGPENLNFPLPESSVTYSIGVHYWKDHGMGLADATIRVFHFSDEIYSATLQDMDVLDMWWVGEIHWPEMEVIPFALEDEDGLSVPRVTPNYVNLFFQPYSF